VDRQVLRIMKKLEKVLVRLAVLGALALVVVQLLVVRVTDPVDFYLAFAQKIEYTPLQQTEQTFEPNLVFTLEGGDGSKLKLLVNDQETGSFSEGKLSLKVKAGDRLAVDARKAAKGLRLKVSGVGQELGYPKLNQVWPLQGSILDLGVVKLK